MAEASVEHQRGGARILIVDDDLPIRRGVKSILTEQGYEAETAGTGQQALATYARWRPDVLLLDLGLPDIDGLDVIRRIREQADTPIVVLSMRGAENDKVAALNLGADDYVNKPFGVAELLARIGVALRHSARPQRGAAPVFRTGDLEVDFEGRRVVISGQEVRLTPTEYDLLKAFIAYPNKILTHQMLLQKVWGPAYGPDSAHYLHVYVGSLRRKLEPNPQRPLYLLTEPGIGYRLKADDA